MKIIEQLIPNHKTTHLQDLFPDPEKVLFFDIETTGLSPKNASVYLIGCAFHTDNGWKCRQYFADTPDEEADILQQFCTFAANFCAFWNFNGTTFDIPFMQAKCKKHALTPFEPADHPDMYRMVRPFKNLLHLSGCRQKQLEEYIGLFFAEKFISSDSIVIFKNSVINFCCFRIGCIYKRGINRENRCRSVNNRQITFNFYTRFFIKNNDF